MTMRFGSLQCIRCSMPGHLSYQCKKPVMPPEPPEPVVEPTVDETYDELYALYDQLIYCSD